MKAHPFGLTYDVLLAQYDVGNCASPSFSQEVFTGLEPAPHEEQPRLLQGAALTSAFRTFSRKFSGIQTELQEPGGKFLCAACSPVCPGPSRLPPPTRRPFTNQQSSKGISKCATGYPTSLAISTGHQYP